MLALARVKTIGPTVYAQAENKPKRKQCVCADCVYEFWQSFIYHAPRIINKCKKKISAKIFCYNGIHTKLQTK